MAKTKLTTRLVNALNIYLWCLIWIAGLLLWGSSILNKILTGLWYSILALEQANYGD